MSADDNVVKMPDRLERRAQKIEAAMKRREVGDQDWIEGTIELAVELAGARADLKADQAFGEWCQGRFGTNVIPAHERAILIRWGSMPNEVRIVLEKTESHSIRVIERGLRTGATTPSKPPGGQQREKAIAFIQVFEPEFGRLPSEIEVANGTTVSRGTAADVLRDIKSKRAEPEVKVQFSKAQTQHVEVRLRMLARKLEAEFDERVRQGVLDGNADYLAALNQLQKEASEKWERYDTLINSYQPIFNETEFVTILTCLHPDNSASKEKRNVAFKAFNAMKLQLTGKK